MTVLSAQEMGIPGLLITSGREGIDMALREAQRILQVMRHERRQAAKLFQVAADDRLLGLPVAAALGERVPAELFSGDEQVQGRIHRVGEATMRRP